VEQLGGRTAGRGSRIELKMEGRIREDSSNESCLLTLIQCPLLLPHASDLFVWLDFAIAVAEHALLAALANYRQWILYTSKMGSHNEF